MRYFQHAQGRRALEEMDAWIRHRLLGYVHRRRQCLSAGGRGWPQSIQNLDRLLKFDPV